MNKAAISYSYRKIQGVYEIGYYNQGSFKVVKITKSYDDMLSFMVINKIA